MLVFISKFILALKKVKSYSFLWKQSRYRNLKYHESVIYRVHSGVPRKKSHMHGITEYISSQQKSTYSNYETNMFFWLRKLSLI